MKLYTRSGDDGDTGLFDGSRVRKDHPRVQAYGSVDELNAHLGLAVAQLHGLADHDGIADMIERITVVQRALFDVGAELATPVTARQHARLRPIPESEISRLEAWIDEAVAAAEPLRSFVLPGGHLAAAQLHVCRTVCRRAERDVVTLRQTASIAGQVIIYLNRVADLLFAWARQVNAATGTPEAKVTWDRPAAEANTEPV